MIRPSASPLSASCRASLRIIVIMRTASHSAVCQPDGLYSVFVSPTSLRPLSCPALGPRVIDRPRDSGFGGCCAASLLLLQRKPDGLYSVFVSPTSLRPLSCPALGPRVIDRPRDSGFGGCCAASLLLLQRNRVAPLRSAHHRELSPRLALFLRLKKKT